MHTTEKQYQLDKICENGLKSWHSVSHLLPLSCNLVVYVFCDDLQGFIESFLYSLTKKIVLLFLTSPTG